MIDYEIDNNISYLLKDKNNIISLLCLTDFYELLKNISYKFENKVVDGGYIVLNNKEFRVFLGINDNHNGISY
jgi:hypothetical protein